LIPSIAQKLWGKPAVANFALGGLGAGLYIAVSLAARFEASSAVTAAAWLAPVLVLAGFAVVATEAGRPLRGIRVLARWRTSWMSRELWIGGVFVVLAAGEFVAPSRPLRLLTAIAAVTLALAQGFIVRCARGVAAWNTPLMPILFLASALVSGCGLLLLIAGGLGLAPTAVILGSTRPLVVLTLLLWLGYLGQSRDAAFVDSTRPLRQRAATITVVAGGYVVPLVLATLPIAVPETAAPAAVVAGLLMVGAQIQTKSLLILTAGRLRPITLDLRRWEAPGTPQAPQRSGPPGGAGVPLGSAIRSRALRRRPS
jgi:DMSO reductase anchor subunit